MTFSWSSFFSSSAWMLIGAFCRLSARFSEVTMISPISVPPPDAAAAAASAARAGVAPSAVVASSRARPVGRRPNAREDMNNPDFLVF